MRIILLDYEWLIMSSYMVVGHGPGLKLDSAVRFPLILFRYSSM